VPTESFFAPAKLNLFLAITGRRPDGFHDLVSVVAPLTFGDTVHAEIDNADASGRLVVTCDDPEVPCDESNLVFKAAAAFARTTGWRGSARFRIEKRMPMGAGLGGGSSDGVAALRALRAGADVTIEDAGLHPLAAGLGSDCPLFLRGAPLIMRGRGERLESLPEVAARWLRGRRVLVFKPAFGIPTVWSYRRLAEMEREGRRAYVPAAEAEARLQRWLADPAAGGEELLFNSLELPAFEKHLALPTLLDRLRADFRLAPRMTGSGSACFAFVPDDAPVAAIAELIRAAWGDSAFVIEARLA
jgi:4-diphosphocytidyl-2-C-methyl-D-erythritol kinase